MQEFITGIQQIGIGVADARAAMLLYKELFGMDVLIFDDVATAALMTQYTGGVKYQRRAILSLNMAGGGGFEIWQFLDRKPVEADIVTQYGDVGIYGAKIKCTDVHGAHALLTTRKGVVLSEIKNDAKNEQFFWVQDRYGNNFQMISDSTWFQNKNKLIGGVSGAVIGVTDIDQSVVLYRDILGINELVYDVVEDVASPDSMGKFRKILLRKEPSGKGAFNKLLGSVEIELVQCLDRKPRKIYQDRYWGDNGFIHLCFDVLNMDALKLHAQAHGFRFTVDSKDSFAMENAAGRFCYVEDKDGTLIELVETHKVPIMKKYGLYLNLKKRGLEKALPDWMIKMLSLSKVK